VDDNWTKNVQGPSQSEKLNLREKAKNRHREKRKGGVKWEKKEGGGFQGRI